MFVPKTVAQWFRAFIVCTTRTRQPILYGEWGAQALAVTDSYPVEDAHDQPGS